MTAPAYATLDDLAQWLDDDLPTSGPAILRTAAYAVADRIATAVYNVDSTTGLPTNTIYREALRDATCAQAAWMIANEIDPYSAGGTPSIESSVGIGTARIVYADANDAAKAQIKALAGLCPEADRIIRRAGFNSVVRDIPQWVFPGVGY